MKKISKQHPSVSNDAEFLTVWSEVEKAQLRTLQAQRTCYTLWSWTAVAVAWAIVAMALKVVFS